MSNLVISNTGDLSHKRASFLITGYPKVGKTSLALTAPIIKDSELLYVAADPGQLALRHRKFTMAMPNEGQKADRNFLEDVYKYVRREVAAGVLTWQVIDGLDVISNAVLRTMLATQKDGRKAYGEMAEYMEDWIFRMRDISGINTLMITHVDIEKVGENDVRFIPMLPGQQLVKKIDGWFDEIGNYRFVKTGENTQERAIQFRPEVDPRYVCGDRSGALDAYEVPNLTTIFNKIHNAGIETQGLALPEPAKIEARSDAEIAALGKLMQEKKKTPAEIQKLSNDAYGKNPRYLTVEQYNELMDTIKKG